MLPSRWGALVHERRACCVRRSAFVLVRCCLEKRRVNPVRSAFPELHPRSGLGALRAKLAWVLMLDTRVINRRALWNSTRRTRKAEHEHERRTPYDRINVVLGERI
jgi:hypothetical protein